MSLLENLLTCRAESQAYVRVSSKLDRFGHALAS